MDLFEQRRQTLIEAEAPLAARMRPRTLDDYVGQAAIVGPGRLLRRAIQADQLSSLIFYGPPGTGKTTLARVIANTTKAHFIAINAVLAGVKDIREAIATAQDLRGQFSRRTILFVDEVHRFNKSQQDALLPWVENGTVILIGATTENPYFEVNKALVSRSRVFQLKALDETDLREIVSHTLSDTERGYGDRTVEIDQDALDHLVNVANGDARALLNALELAVETTPPDTANIIRISLTVAEESIQQRAVLYDKEGDAHFDTISAFIKSLRGSDPDATLYWLARMIYAGEDPRYIFRRMVILAGEDIGLADPNAIVVVNGCAQAFDRVGMPEGRYPLAQAALYLATCPKSNSVMGFFEALATVEKEREADVPNALRDPNRDKESFGHGKGYLYPHAYRDHWIEQQYLPGSLQGQVFYQPSDQGYEDTIRLQVARRREAQLAALLENNGVASPGELTEALTYGPINSAQDRWLQRAMGQAGKQLGDIRDRIFELAAPQRHHVILDLHATSGLLTWEAIRQVPEGGVYARVNQVKDFEALREQAALLPEISRPILLQTPLAQLTDTLTAQSPDLKFDRMIGRNALMALNHKAQVIEQMVDRLQPNGLIILAETIPQQSQRLWQLLTQTNLSPKLQTKFQLAEESLYTDSNNPMINWNHDNLQQWFEQCEVSVKVNVISMSSPMKMTDQLINRWFGPETQFYQTIATTLSKKEITTIRTAFSQQFRQQTIPWLRNIAMVKAAKRPTELTSKPKT